MNSLIKKWLIVIVFIDIGLLVTVYHMFAVEPTSRGKRKHDYTSMDGHRKEIFQSYGDFVRPNIVFILADDYGWRDIGYHGSDIRTPYLDKLASEGVKLENYYVLATCSPSRASILSGKYSSQTTINRMMVPKDQCPTRDMVIIPDKLREHGYTTHLVGKWHVGMLDKGCYPDHQGFDTFFGFLGACQDYFSHTRKGDALDFWDNGTQVDAFRGQYSTHLFAQRSNEIIKSHSRSKVPMFLYLPLQSVHTPLQVPDKYVKPYQSEEFSTMDDKRKLLAAMTSCMDEAVHNVTDALKKYGLWENTVVVFSSDNGGSKAAHADNGHLRGYKSSYFEGGIRVNGFISSPLLPALARGTEFHGLMGAADWFSTLVEGVAEIPMSGISTDGYNLWDAIRYGSQSPRQEYVYAVGGNCDWTLVSSPDDRWMYGTIRMGNWKLLLGPPWQVERIKPPTLEFYDGNQYNEKHLYNIDKDPSEENNLFEDKPDVVEHLMNRLRKHCRNSLPPIMVQQEYCPKNMSSKKQHDVCAQSKWLQEIYMNATIR